MRKDPVQVYLDSSDYSNLARRSENTLFQEQYLRLKSLVDDAVVQVRYSGINILEAAHVGPEHLQYAMARAETMENLCGGNTLVLQTDLHTLECTSCVTAKRVTRQQVYRDSNGWLTDFSDIAETIESEIVGQLMIESGANNRPERRAFKKRVLKNGKLRSEHIDAISSGVGTTSTTLYQKYPVLKNVPLDQYIVDFLSGKISAKAFGLNLCNQCFSPIAFTKYFYDMYRQQPAIQQDILRYQGGANVAMVDNFRNILTDLENLEQLHGKSPTDTTQKARALFDRWISPRTRLLEEVYAKDISKKLSLPINDIRRILVAAKPGELPGLDFTTQLSWQYAIQMTIDQRANLSVSDHADVLHTNYVPYIDIFRADKRMKPHIDRICRERCLKTYIAKSLHDLLDHIDLIRK